METYAGQGLQSIIQAHIEAARPGYTLPYCSAARSICIRCGVSAEALGTQLGKFGCPGAPGYNFLLCGECIRMAWNLKSRFFLASRSSSWWRLVHQFWKNANCIKPNIGNRECGVLPVLESVCELCRIPRGEVFRARIESPMAGLILAMADLCDGCRLSLNIRGRTTLEAFQLTGHVSQIIHGFQISWCLMCGDDQSWSNADTTFRRAYDNCARCRDENTPEQCF
jgi:hypothetical protein